MTTLTTPQAHTPIPALSDSPRTLWGLLPLQVHDRLWAARAVCVVRPGHPAPPERGPGLYLLLRQRDMVDFSIAAARDELFAVHADALHLRIIGPRARRHDEVIRQDASGAFVLVARLYSRGPVRTTSCWVTPSHEIATAWAALSGHAPSRQLKAARITRRPATAKLSGTIINPKDPRAFSAWLCHATESLGRITAVLPDVYHFQDGVWAHAESRIGQGVRFAGPALVGAGVHIPDATTVIGPVILHDLNTPLPPRPVEWGVLAAPMWRIVPGRRPGSFYVLTKRAFDVLVSLLVLATMAPLAPLILLLIYLEDGRPFFFAHTRQTLGGRDFPCYKFRTMVKDAEKLKAHLAPKNQADGPQFFIKDDPRLLTVGRWLRRFQVDEIPQFWNVLVGDMSLVGPRPSPDRENQFCPAWRDARLSVRPGITGLWQVRRTREPDTDFQEWIRYDLEYVQRRSWSLDLWIIVLTVRRVLLNA